MIDIHVILISWCSASINEHFMPLGYIWRVYIYRTQDAGAAWYSSGICCVHLAMDLPLLYQFGRCVRGHGNGIREVEGRDTGIHVGKGQ